MTRGAAILLLLLLLAGCQAPKTAVDLTAPPVTYYTSSNPSTFRRVETYTAPDGSSLEYVSHRGTAPTSSAIVYLHGLESHAGWFDEAADDLCAAGYDVYCLDRRGSGLNREDRGFPSGHVDWYETLFDDVGAFVQRLETRYRSITLIGYSWGGKLALGYAIAHPEHLDGIVLITPVLAAEIDLTLGQKLDALGGSAMEPMKPIPTPVQPEMVTNTPRWLDRIERDPRRLRYATARFFMETEQLDEYIRRDVPRNRLPILVFLAGQDRVVDNDGVLELLERGGQEVLDVRVYEDQMHAIPFDAPDRLVSDTATWLGARPVLGAAPSRSWP
jgi:alpha-beta hydrolase superfamily lysophospholipase